MLTSECVRILCKTVPPGGRVGPPYLREKNGRGRRHSFLGARRGLTCQMKALVKAVAMTAFAYLINALLALFLKDNETVERNNQHDSRCDRNRK